MDCLTCGKDCDDFLCSECAQNANIEKICIDLCNYKPFLGGNQIWDNIVNKNKKSDILLDYACMLSDLLASPRKEYIKFLSFLDSNYHVSSINREWIYKKRELLESSCGISYEEKNTIYTALLNAYIEDYNFFEADKIAEILRKRKNPPFYALYNMSDFYMKTRRYEIAELITEFTIELFDDDESKKIINRKKNELENRRDGLMAHYMPIDDKGRNLYIEFMNSIGIPVIKSKKRFESTSEKTTNTDITYGISAGFKSFVAYDLETTGFSDEYDSIIEIGAVKVVDGVITDEFQTFVKPYKRGITYKITEITGITNDMVKDAPLIEDAFNKFADFIGDDIIIGFNNRSFDNRFLNRASIRSERNITNKSFDVMRYAANFKQRLGDETRGSYSLAKLSALLEIENPQAHRAVADSITTAKIYLKLLEMDES